MTKRLLAGVFLGLLAPGLGASESLNTAAGFAFPSIQQGASARAIAMGSTYVGIAEGSASLLWNPAGLANLSCSEIALHHNSALLDAYQEFLVLGLPMGPGNGLGVSLNYEDAGAFEGRDTVGALAKGYNASAYGVNVGWGMKIPAGFSLGLGLKINHQDLAGTAENAFASDLGVLWSHSPRLNVGLAYTNLGPNVNGMQLAQGFRLGVSSIFHKDQDFQWLAAMSAEALTYGENSLHFGLEQTLYKFLALRAGYAFNIPNNPDASGGLVGWTFGGGIMVRHFALDYAYVPLAELGGMQRISLTYAFGGDCCGLTSTAKVSTSKSYTVKKGDSLWKISGKSKVRGDSFQWPLLYDANSAQISDPDQIETKQKLTYEKKYTKAEIKDAVNTAEKKPTIVP